MVILGLDRCLLAKEENYFFSGVCTFWLNVYLFQETEQTILWLSTIKKEGAKPMDDLENVVIIIKGVAVLHDPGNIANALVILFDLMYSSCTWTWDTQQTSSRHLRFYKNLWWNWMAITSQQRLKCLGTIQTRHCKWSVETFLCSRGKLGAGVLFQIIRKDVWINTLNWKASLLLVCADPVSFHEISLLIGHFCNI